MGTLREKLERKWCRMPDAAWKHLYSIMGPVDDYDSESEWLAEVLQGINGDWLEFARLCNTANLREFRPRQPTRGRKRGVYLRSMKRRWKMYEFAENYSRPRDWQMIAKRWNERSGENVSATAYERLYYKTVSEAWSPEFEKHVLDPVRRETERYKERGEAWDEAHSIRQFYALIKMSGSAEATLDLGMHRVISARRDSSQVLQDVWESLWELVKSAYATDPAPPLTPEEQPRVTAGLLAKCVPAWRDRP